MFADQNILDEIVKKKEFLEKRKQADIHMLISGMFDGALEREALEHSLRIEYPLVNRLDEAKPDAAEYQRLSNNLKKAWGYGRKHFKTPFDKQFLLAIANYVEPDAIKGDNGYRPMGVRPANASVTPPYPAKIEQSMSKFFAELNQLQKSCNNDCDYIKNCIDIGSWIHLHLARIHPFEDGNGRTARIIHNLFLRNLDALPPVIIYEGERKDYINHLDSAVYGFKERDGESEGIVSRPILSQGEREFYDYMAGKLNVSLDRILQSQYR